MIRSEGDLENFRMPAISVDEEKTRENYDETRNLYDGIFDVRLKGVWYGYFWPWNNVIAWLGIENSLAAMAEQPQLAHKIMWRVVDVEKNHHIYYSKASILLGFRVYQSAITIII